jgi:uncharacterized membrane protein YphA (DoxX/SURF4 family)
MFIACVVVSVLLGLMALGSAMGKLTKAQTSVDTITGVGVPLAWFPWLGAAEILGGLGVIVGLAVAPLGVAAAGGLVLYFLGAVGAHLRKQDYQGARLPALPLLLSIAALILRLATL